MNEIQHIGGGLTKLPKDDKEFSFGAFFKVDKVPDFEFNIGSSEILDQKDTDFCSAFATCGASSLQEKKTLNPYWSFAKSKELSGDIESWGQDLRSACKVHQKFGAIEYDREFSLEKHDKSFLRDIKNYPDFTEQAKVHKKQAYFAMDSFRSKYDSIVSAIWKFKDEKRAGVTGMLWRGAWNNVEGGIIPGLVGNQGEFGHAFIFTGQKYIKNKPHLIAQLSNGEEIGDKGFYYFPKIIVDKEATYGNYMFLDMPSSWQKEEIIKESQYYRAGFYGKVWNITKRFFFL